VKKNYKGNWEVLKHHKNLKNWTEQNKILCDFNKKNPIDNIIASILNNKLQTKLRYLRLQKLKGNQYELGDRVKIKSELCMLVE
jgi:hypothetical protein